MEPSFVAALHVVQFVVLIVVGVTLAIIILLIVLDKKNALKQVGFLAWCIHGFIYYSAVSFIPVEKMITITASEFYTGWSVALRLHGFATLGVVVLDNLLRILHRRGITITGFLNSLIRVVKASAKGAICLLVKKKL